MIIQFKHDGMENLPRNIEGLLKRYRVQYTVSVLRSPYTFKAYAYGHVADRLLVELFKAGIEYKAREERGRDFITYNTGI